MGIFKSLVFVALAASGKSETITFIKNMPPEMRVEKLHIGSKVIILDDFPYVDLMRHFDKVLDRLGEPPLFFPEPRKGFLEPRISWKLLILLLNGDYHNLLNRQDEIIAACETGMLQRFDRARKDLGARPLFFNPDGEPLMGRSKYKEFIAQIKEKVLTLVEARNSQIPENLEDVTVLIEFARGGEYGAQMPIPCGYQDSFGALSPEILKDTAFLYLKVLPEQAALKNFLRADPQDPSSILGHCVPYGVMFRDYGCDDFEWHLSCQEFMSVITIFGPMVRIPASIMDNTMDLTSFVREECKGKPFEEWPKKPTKVLLQALEKSCGRLWGSYFIKHKEELAI